MKKLLQLFKKEERGMTLVELLAVIVILGIIGGIAFVSVSNIIENSRQDAHIANAQQVISAVKLAEASGDLTLKNDEKATAGGESPTAELAPYIETLTSPWGDDSYTATVTKSIDGDVVEYSITFEGEGCNIDSKTEAELSGDRDAVCGTEGGNG